MKKEICLLVIIAGLLILSTVSGGILDFFKSPVTGKASSQGTSLSITVQALLPTLTIISPTSTTYSTNSILLNYTTANADTVWYSLDGASNITINSSTTLILADGSYSLFLYANNSEGNINWTNVSFSVDTSGGGVVGGGGGGGSVIGKKDFLVDKEEVDFSVEKGRGSITIKNTEKSSQSFELSLSSDLKDLVSVSETSFTLESGEERIVYLDLLDKKIEGDIRGTLRIRGKDREKEITIKITFIDPKKFEIREITRIPTYLSLEFEYDKGVINLIGKSLETGFYPTLSHNVEKEFRINSYSKDEDLLYSYSFDPGSLFSDENELEKSEEGLIKFEKNEFYLAVPEASKKIEILKRGEKTDVESKVESGVLISSETPTETEIDYEEENVSLSSFDDCEDECRYDEHEIICAENEYTEKTCGNYDSDLCMEWNIENEGIDWIVSEISNCVDDKREIVSVERVCNSEPRSKIIPCGCVLQLEKGLNFVSICEELSDSDYSIENILRLIGDYEYILEWDAFERRYRLWNKEGTQEFSKFDKEKSYFIYYTGEPRAVSLEGKLYEDIDIEVPRGLNTPIYPYETYAEIKEDNFYGLNFDYIFVWDNKNKKFRMYNSDGTQEINKILFGEGFFVNNPEGRINYKSPDRTI